MKNKLDFEVINLYKKDKSVNFIGFAVECCITNTKDYSSYCFCILFIIFEFSINYKKYKNEKNSN